MNSISGHTSENSLLVHLCPSVTDMRHDSYIGGLGGPLFPCLSPCPVVGLVVHHYVDTIAPPPTVVQPLLILSSVCRLYVKLLYLYLSCTTSCKMRMRHVPSVRLRF